MKKSIPFRVENNEVLFAGITDSKNLALILFCRNGNVFYFDRERKTTLILSEILLDPDELEIHSHQNYIAVVENRGKKGIVVDVSNKNYLKNLERGEYQVKHCSFPIAFYGYENQTFLIHGTDWNRLDVTCLENDEPLTDRKIDYKTGSNYFDYFHGSLLMSPDSTKFTSNGWVWGPTDIITIYLTEEFLKNFELSNKIINYPGTSGYNWGRPLCWVDNSTLAFGYNKKEDGEHEGDCSSEIIFVDVLSNKVINQIGFDGFAVNEFGEVEGNLYFDEVNKQFIGLNTRNGLLICDAYGKEIYRDLNLISHQYSPKHKLFYWMNYEKQIMEIITLDD